jgi:hypothetical protein
MSFALRVCAVALVLSLCACRGGSPGLECGEALCRDHELCDQATLLCVANVPPVVVLVSPAPGALVTGPTLLVTGEVHDDEDRVQAVEASFDGELWLPIAFTAGAFTFSATTPTRDHQPVTIRVRGRDRLGQEGRAEVEVVVDTLGPSCQAQSPHDSQRIGAGQGSTFPVAFTVTDGSGPVASAELSFDQGASFVPAAVSEGQAVGTWQLPASNGEDHLILLRAADRFGNVGTCAVTAVVDLFPPTVAITAPSEDALLGPAATTHVTVTGVASDGSAPPPSVYVLIEGGDEESAAQVQASGAWAGAAKLGEDDFVVRSLRVRAVDRGGNETVATRTVRVDRVAPRVSVTSPDAGQRFNIAALGGSTHVRVTWTAQDGDSVLTHQVSIDGATPQPAAPGEHFVATDPQDDGDSRIVAALVTDRAGNTGSSPVSFAVDRVPPQWTLSPAEGERVAPRVVRFTVHSEFTPVGAPVVLSPEAPTVGSWQDNVYEIANLAPDTVYQAVPVAGGAVDTFGNPNEGGPAVRFHTEGVLPSSGSVLVPAASAFEATSDEDGVVSIASKLSQVGTTLDNELFTFTTVNPATGLPQTLQSFSKHRLSVWGIAASAWIDSDFVARRLRGYAVSHQAKAIGGAPPPPIVFDATWRFGEGAWTSTTGAQLVPTPAGCADPVGLPELGVISFGGLYERGTLSEETGVTPPHQVLVRSKDRWEVIGGSPAVTRTRACSCATGSPACVLWPEQPLVPLGLPEAAPLPALSAAVTATSGYRLYVVSLSNGERVELCRTCTSGGCPAQGEQTALASEQLYVAARPGTDTVIGARRLGGALQVVERSLATSCTGPWTVLGSLAVGGDVTAWRPVMFGRRPGAVYLEGSQLKAFVP